VVAQEHFKVGYAHKKRNFPVSNLLEMLCANEIVRFLPRDAMRSVADDHYFYFQQNHRGKKHNETNYKIALKRITFVTRSLCPTAPAKDNRIAM